MRIKKYVRGTMILAILLLFPFQTLLAEEEFPDDVQDVPAAPIDNFIIIAIVIALAFAFYFLKKIERNKS